MVYVQQIHATRRNQGTGGENMQLQAVATTIGVVYVRSIDARARLPEVNQ
jgi:hypothetical protein